MSPRHPARMIHPRQLLVGMAILSAFAARAETTNAIAAPLPPLPPEVAPSLLRVCGALVLVIGIFLGGVWLFRNWQRLALQNGRRPKLNILETRALGGRQALYVVSFEQGRFLIASSPAGVSLLSHLPDAPVDELAKSENKSPTFALTLAGLLKSK